MSDSSALLLPETAGAISRSNGEPRLARNIIKRLTHLPGLQLVEMYQPLVQEAAWLAFDVQVK